MGKIQTSVIFSLPDARAARLAAIIPVISAVALFTILLVVHAQLVPVLGAFTLVLLSWVRWFSLDHKISLAESWLKSSGLLLTESPGEVDPLSYEQFPTAPPPRVFSA